LEGLRTAGVDSGTLSVDIVAVEETGDGVKVFYEEAVPRSRVVEDPAALVDILERLVREEGVESIVMSSGYGVGLKRAGEAEPWEIDVATFIHPWDESLGLRILGLRAAMRLIRERGLPAWFTPGVVQLPTVPAWRKRNRIDLGTSDKLYSVAAAAWDAVENRGESPESLDMVVLEVGYAYTAAIAVKAGRVVDGLGGTAGFQGYMGLGCWDSEVAYLLAWLEPGFSKNLLFRGGVSEELPWQGRPPSPEEVAEAAARGDEAAETVLRALAEAAAKDVYALLAVVEPRAVYVTGRWTRVRPFMELLEEKLGLLTRRLGAELRRVEATGTAKEAAFGAAVLANGLAGGRYEWLPRLLGLHETSGTTPLDYVELAGAGLRAKQYFQARGQRG